MPIVPYKLDPGFNRPPLFRQYPLEEPERAQGGFLQFGKNLEVIGEDIQTELSVLGAGATLENMPAAALELLTRPTWKPDPNFDLEANLKAADLWEEHRWNYIGVESAGEFLYKTRKILKEKKARELIAASGPRGVVALMTMSAADPTILLPFIGVGSKLGRGLAVGAAWGIAAGTIQEVPLQLNQELRTLEESGMNVAFATVLGGVFGGALASLRGVQLQRIADDMDPSNFDRAISPLEERVLIERTVKDLEVQRAKGDQEVRLDVDAELDVYRARLRELDSKDAMIQRMDEVDNTMRDSLGKATAAGADVMDLDPGTMRNMLGVGERLTVLGGAVTAALGQRVSNVGRRMMAELSTAGLRMERNVILDREGNIIGGIASNQGGPVEALINFRKGETLGLVQKAYDEYANYRMTPNKTFGLDSRFLRNARAGAPGGTGLSRRQFFEEVGRAMRRGDEHEVPQVQNTAQAFRQYYDKLLAEAQDLGIIPREIEEVTPDLSYLNRVFDTAAIGKNPNEFRRMLEDHFKQSLHDEVNKIQGGYESATMKDRQRLADAELPLEEAQRLRDQFRKELEALDQVENAPELRPMEEMISDLRAQMAANTRERRVLEKALASEDSRVARRRPLEEQIQELQSARETLREEVERLQAAGGSDMAERALRRQELRRRVRNLNRSRFMVEEKHRAKLDKIENLEEANVEALHRVARAGVRAQAAVDKDADAFVKAMTDMSSAVTAAKNSAIKLEGQIDAIVSKTAAKGETARPSQFDVDAARAEADEISARANAASDRNLGGAVGEKPTDAELELRDALRQATSKSAAIGPVTRNAVIWARKNGRDDIADEIVRKIEEAQQHTPEGTRSRQAYDEFLADLPEAPKRQKAEVVEDEAEFQRLFQKDQQHEQAIARFLELEDELESFKNIELVERGRDEAIGAIQDALDLSLRKVEAVNARRTKRVAKLEAGAAKLDKQAWQKHIDDIQARMKARKERAKERVNGLGGIGYDPDFGAQGVDFNARAAEMSQITTDKIMGVNMRLPGFDAITDKRGAEIARMLSMPSEPLSRAGFLVDDAEHLLHVYANTLVPDIEIVRRMGPFAPDGNLNIKFKELNEEQVLVEFKAEAALRREHTKNGVLNEAKFQAAKDKLMPSIRQEYTTLRKNLEVVIKRLRHQWGIPSDPNSWLTRGVQMALMSNSLRFLGTVGVASIPDVGKPIMRYGLGRTLKAGWIPLVNNWKALKLTKEEAQKAFVGVEVETADRAFMLADLMDQARGKTPWERGMQWATSKMGIIALYAPWTDMQKRISFRAMTDKVMESLELSVMQTGSSKKRAEAISFLNSLGWNDDLQLRIWNQMQDGGAEKMNGLWVPQTDRWTDPDAVRSFRAAANAEASSSVITPGVERPKIADMNLPAKLFFNLKSFALSSTSKTFMAGLGQRDTAVLNAVWVSLAMGALSYYLRAVATGGETDRRMREATWEQWVDEAVDASGLLGAISLGQRVASGIPFAKNFATIGGAGAALRGESAPQTSRSSGAGLVEDVFGTNADLAFTVAQALTGLDNPTRAQIHKVRSLLPFQNLVYIRRLFDQMENSFGDSINATGKRR